MNAVEGKVAEAGDRESGGNDRFNNRIALTIAVLASFLALSTIKSSNLSQAMDQAQAERNNSWAWYQAVRVREDMASYELAYLQRLARTQAPASQFPSEAGLLAAEIAAQETELAHVRARKDEVEQRARGAETQHAALSVLGDQYDLSDALIAIAMTLFAVCALAKARWLYWFALIPAVAGAVLGATAMAAVPIPPLTLLAWLN
jgi:hypothetical protein